MLQQDRLADPCLATEYQDAALARAHGRDESVQHLALVDPVQQPSSWMAGVPHGQARIIAGETRVE
jgi:hypothetical protein